MKALLTILILSSGFAGLMLIRNIGEDGGPFGCAVIAVIFGLLIFIASYMA